MQLDPATSEMLDVDQAFPSLTIAWLTRFAAEVALEELQRMAVTLRQGVTTAVAVTN